MNNACMLPINRARHSLLPQAVKWCIRKPVLTQTSQPTAGMYKFYYAVSIIFAIIPSALYYISIHKTWQSTEQTNYISSPVIQMPIRTSKRGTLHSYAQIRPLRTPCFYSAVMSTSMKLWQKVYMHSVFPYTIWYLDVIREHYAT
jgi:hypothetical protein